MSYVAIMIGGGIGAVSRYALSKFVFRIYQGSFPAGTLVVNLAGCFFIGFLAALFERYIISPNVRLFVFVGFLGGFTTFSSFGLESFNLLKGGEIKFALINILASNIAGIALLVCGYVLSKTIFR